MSVCYCHRGSWACRSPSRGFDIDHFLRIQSYEHFENSCEHHVPSTIAAAQLVRSRFFWPTRTVHYNSMLHVPLHGEVVSTFVLLVSSIRVPVAVASQVRSLIFTAVEDSSVRFLCYEHLKKLADFLNIVEAILSKKHGAFDSKYSQNRQKQ